MQRIPVMQHNLVYVDTYISEKLCTTCRGVIAVEGDDVCRVCHIPGSFLNIGDTCPKCMQGVIAIADNPGPIF